MASSKIRNSNSPVVNDLNYLNDLYYTDIYSNSALLGHGILLYYHCTTTTILVRPYVRPPAVPAKYLVVLGVEAAGENFEKKQQQQQA